MSEINRPESGKPKARLITMVWGETYLADLLDICLPAMLAPGNLPALTEHFDCELVIVTEESNFRRIAGSPVFKEIQKHCRAWPIMADDLVVSRRMYGHSLTFALHRGFEDLGEKVTETFLLFFNADFILADGCYEVLARHMLAGERLVFSPSYCAVDEEVGPLLKSKVDEQSKVLAVPKREMAALALKYPQNTVQAKTLNRPLFRINVNDQFYWRIGDHTLLGHQLPIAIVCMKPEGECTEPAGFWDYSTISTMGPNLPRCVLGDSDEFLMLELRGRDTHMELLEIGRPNPAETAAVLGDYMTADQFEMGRYPLVLHSQDLPENIDEERTKLRTYVDEVYSLLPENPIDYNNHPYWTGLIDRFKKNQKEWWAKRDAKNNPQNMVLENEDSEYATTPVISNPPDFKYTDPEKPKLIKRLYHKFFGQLPRVTVYHPYWADMHRAAGLLEDAVKNNSAIKTLILKSEDSMLCRILETAPGTHTLISPHAIMTFPLAPDARDFDICLLELNWSDLQELRTYIDLIRDRIKPGKKIIAFHTSGHLRSFNKKSVAEIIQLIPTRDPMKIYFSGSKKINRLIESQQYWLNRAALAKRFSGLYLAAGMMGNALRCRAANLAVATNPPFEVPEICTGLTIEIDVPDSSD
jgi:hypothetical protein